MAGDATPPSSPPPPAPELPPGLLAEYLESARAQLGVVAGLAERLVVAGGDRDALDALRRETHKVHGPAGSRGFLEASRIAAGMEATVQRGDAPPDAHDGQRAAPAGGTRRRTGRRRLGPGGDLRRGRRGARRAARVRVTRPRVSVFGVS